MLAVKRLPVEAALTPEGWADYATWSRIQGIYALGGVAAGVIMGVSGVYAALLSLELAGVLGVVPDFPITLLIAVLAVFAASTAAGLHSAFVLWQAPVYIDGRCEQLNPSEFVEQGEPAELVEDDEDPAVAIARAVAA